MRKIFTETPGLYLCKLSALAAVFRRRLPAIAPPQVDVVLPAVVPSVDAEFVALNDERSVRLHGELTVASVVRKSNREVRSCLSAGFPSDSLSCYTDKNGKHLLLIVRVLLGEVGRRHFINGARSKRKEIILVHARSNIDGEFAPRC